MDGDFSDMPAFKKKSNWCPVRNREVAIEKYVEALEKKIFSHGFNVPYQRNLTRVEERGLNNLCWYDDIIIKQEDKESAVVVIDRDVYIEKARRQLSDSNVYTPLDVNPTETMV